MNGPEQVSRQLVQLLNAGDIDGVVALYENEAIFAEVDKSAHGLDAIRAALQEFYDAGLVLALNDSAVFETGDIALVHWSWTVTRPNADPLEGTSAEVLRRNADGQWKYVIDNSDGSAVLGAARS